MKSQSALSYGCAATNAACSAYDFATSNILTGVVMGAFAAFCLWVPQVVKKTYPFTSEYDKIVERAKSIKVQKNIQKQG